jgi:hypothetical protein
MKKEILLSISLAVFASFASAGTVICTVTGGTVLNAQNGGTSFIIDGGNGATTTDTSTGVISCPAITADPGFVIDSYQVIASTGFISSLSTPIPTSVQMLYTLVGGSQDGVTGGATADNGPGLNANPSNPISPYAIGANLSGDQAAFSVLVSSTVLVGAPVASSGSVGITYTEVSAASTPEPATFGLMGSTLLGLGFLIRRRK